jgi:hypothetical protein
MAFRVRIRPYSHPHFSSSKFQISHRLYSVTEISAFLVSLLSNFEFELDGLYDQVYKTASNVMTPTVRGDVLEKGTQMRFKVRVAARDGAGDDHQGLI